MIRDSCASARRQKTFPRRFLALVCAVTIVALPLACRDSESIAPGALRGPVPAAFNTITDPDLNYSDSWVEATQTVAETTFVTTDEAIIDPVTEQTTTQITLAEAPQSIASLAGYGYNGALRVTTGYSTTGGGDISTVQQIDDATGDTDQGGFTSTIVLDGEPAWELGTLVDAQVDVTGSSSGFSCTGDCVLTTLLPSRHLAPSDATSSPSSTVTRVDETHVRVTEIWTEKSEAARSIQATADPVVRHVRDYEKRGADWILTRVRNESTVRHAGGEMRSVQNVTISNVKWNRNAVEDAKRKVRRQLRGQGANLAVQPPSRARRSETCDPTTAIVPCDGGGSGGGGSSPPSGYPTVPRIDEAALIETNAATYPGTGDVSLVLQHGMFSADQTWAQMHPWLETDVSVFAIVRKSLPWRETYENQAQVLHQKLRTEANIPGPVILMGHSNGGMISRYLGRHPDAYDEANGTSSYEPLNVRGVVTLGTPHKGAPLARHARGLSNVLGYGGWTAKIVCMWTQMAGCLRFGELATSPIRKYVEQHHSAWPVTTQMQPNSAYHADFNAQPESFQRYGVQSYLASKNWHLWGLNGDMSCFPSESCGGRAEVKKTERIYKRDISCAIVGIFVGRWGKAAKCALDATILKAVDVLTNRHVGAREVLTDGIVPQWSQLYPNIPTSDQYEIYNGPHHTGETKSWEVFGRFKLVLRDRFVLSVR